MIAFIKKLFSKKQKYIFKEEQIDDFFDTVRETTKHEFKTSLLKELDKVDNMISKQQLKAIIEWVFR